MREDILADNRTKLCKCSDRNHTMRANCKTNGNPSKAKSSSSWGSHIVKGFTTDKKAKLQSSIPNKKLSLACSEISNQKDQYVPYHSRVKRSLISDFPCSINAAQVHPHVFDCHRINSPASHDLFNELDHVRNLLQESKERELLLHAELLAYKENPKVSDLERELDIKRSEIGNLVCRVGSLEAEKTNLSHQLASLSSILDRREEKSRQECDKPTLDHSTMNRSLHRKLEMEVLELRRLNKELQLQKRNLGFRLSSAESQLATLAKISESDVVAKVEAEALLLRHTNEDLCKQVEGLQMSRLNEVEELAYLRWINSCLRQELHNSNQSRMTSFVDLEETAICKTNGSAESDLSDLTNLTCFLNKSVSAEFANANSGGLVERLMKGPDNNKIDEPCQVLECQDLIYKGWVEAHDGGSPRRRHSISGPKGCADELLINKRRQSDGFIGPKELEKELSANVNQSIIKDRHHRITQKYEFGVVQSPRFFVNRSDASKVTSLDVEKRALRIPNPPPRPSTSVSTVSMRDGTAPIPPPPPPPPPPPHPKFSARRAGVMQRAPQVVELYHSLMKRDSKKDSSSGGICDAPNVENVRSSMIGEIENRSSHLLAIKADVETQGEFVRSLIREVNGAVYCDIEDVVAFVKWLDDELCFLVDERAVLKHFDWPERKADTLREAAFGYRDLKKLESEVSHYEDDPRLPCDVVLKKMVIISEKMERIVYNLLRIRDGLMRHCKEFQIPTDWMLDTGLISKIKIASVKLAKKYMKRIAMELQSMGASDKDPALEYMLLQGVRFAFRIHQFAGGFDAETMHAFEELRNLVHV